MFRQKLRPSTNVSTSVEKSSSVSTTAAAWRATSVPPRPMATPTSARRKAGASLTPSPVMATTWPRRRSPSMIRSLSSGVALAITGARSSRRSSSSSGSSASSPPVIQGPVTVAAA